MANNSDFLDSMSPVQFLFAGRFFQVSNKSCLAFVIKSLAIFSASGRGLCLGPGIMKLIPVASSLKALTNLGVLDFVIFSGGVR